MELGHAAKVLATGTPAIFTGGEPGARAGDEGLAFSNPELQAPENLTLRSDGFQNEEPIPAVHSADGGNVSPRLTWSNIPNHTRSFALIVEDPDAPLPKPFVHWIVYNIPNEFSFLPPALPTDSRLYNPPMMQGKNSSLKVGFTGWAPPKGDRPHRYFFQLFALDTPLNLDPGAGRTELLDAMAGHVLGRGRLVGTYQR